jgi:hypothetical protein
MHHPLLKDVATVCYEGLAEDGVRWGESRFHRLGVLLLAFGASSYSSEQEGRCLSG